MITRLLLFAWLLAALPAQQIRVANHSPLPWHGWIATTVDKRPTVASGYDYTLGRQIGPDTWSIDLRMTLMPGDSREIFLGDEDPTPFTIGPLPSNPLEFFGGWAMANGVPLAIHSIGVDGRRWCVHLRGRVSPMLHVDVWLDWRPDDPGYAVGEAAVTASNSGVPDLHATAPDGVRFGFGDAGVHVLGKGWGGEIVPPGTRFGDGQCRAVPIVVAWRRHLEGDWGAVFRVGALAQLQLRANGIRKLWPEGNPRMPANFDSVAWTTARWPEAVRRVNTWEAPMSGPLPASSATGEQGDQVFAGGEATVGKAGPEAVFYLSALKIMARPSHHLKPNGDRWDQAEKPGLQFWDGRPHWATFDLLGKQPGAVEFQGGFFGPDNEHLFYNELVAAARITGSRALQWELEQQCHVFLFQHNIPGPGRENWNSAGAGASRAVGWECLFAYNVDRVLENRALAARVVQRVQQRINTVILPAYANQERDIVDRRFNDGRLGEGWWWMPWQQAVAGYYLDLVGERWGMQAARECGLRLCDAVVRDGWKKVGSRWVSAPHLPVHAEGVRNEDFNYFGNSLAVACVLKHRPTDERAGEIWRQLESSASQLKDYKWLAPEAKAPSLGQSSASYGSFVWTFAQPRPVGTFATGEPWVVGPVTVTAITPAATFIGGRHRNGAMLNPGLLRSPLNGTGAQGYDSALFTNCPQPIVPYDHAKNVATQLPLTIQTGSLVSVLSGDPGEGGVSHLLDAAVLTVLAEAPPEGAFRPAYVGTNKAIPGTLSQVDWSVLASLPVAGQMPPIEPLRAKLQHLWLDHCPEWVSRYLHTQSGLTDYYRNFTSEIGTAALAANCATVPEGVRREMTVRLVQIGIDNYAVMANGARWGVNGHCNGRKFPILFAGRMLGRADMLAAGATWPATLPGKVPFSEDGQVFYVSRDPDGRINGGFGGYTAADIGLPEWGNFHAENRSSDDASWPGITGYRVCCSANGWVGQTLAMRVMGLRAEWNQPAYFDYMDRYMTHPAVSGWQRAWEPWHAAMWDAYRGQF